MSCYVYRKSSEISERIYKFIYVTMHNDNKSEAFETLRHHIMYNTKSNPTCLNDFIDARTMAALVPRLDFGGRKRAQIRYISEILAELETNASGSRLIDSSRLIRLNIILTLHYLKTKVRFNRNSRSPLTSEDLNFKKFSNSFEI